MKVTSGKLQIGDVKHWKDGGKIVYDAALVEMDNNGNYSFTSNPIGWILEEPTDVKKITRKTPKPQERELGPDELMQVCDVIKYDNGSPIKVVDSNSIAIGMRVSSVVGYPNACKVFRPVTSARISRREYKRRVKEALALCDELDDQFVGGYAIRPSDVGRITDILKGETQ